MMRIRPGVVQSKIWPRHKKWREEKGPGGQIVWQRDIDFQSVRAEGSVVRQAQGIALVVVRKSSLVVGATRLHARLRAFPRNGIRPGVYAGLAGPFNSAVVVSPCHARSRASSMCG
jgi:hypothetical protein